jgi:membrane protease YdiL (CAAX protease family)
MTIRLHGRQELTTYLALTFALSGLFYWRIISAGSLGAKGGLYVFALMWSPGVSALVTRLVFQRNLRGEGWLPGSPRWLALAYLVPVLYASVAYGVVWVSGLGAVDLTRFRTPVTTFLIVGSLQSFLSATGEELGWRGFLVPELARTMSLGRTAFVSGAIWALWHMPLIIFADYNAGTATWYALLCFAFMVVAMSFPMAWLRLRSGSVWPAVIIHASHNLFVQGFFDQVTVNTGPTLWLTTEFGAALAVTIGLTAWLFWRVRDAVPSRATSSQNVEMVSAMTP